jgi:hypothetical protein
MEHSKVSSRDLSWRTRDTVSLIIGIPACIIILTLGSSKTLLYGSAAVLCVAAPLAALTLQGVMLAVAWCGGALVLKVPIMAAGWYLGQLVVRFGAILFRSRGSSPTQ